MTPTSPSGELTKDVDLQKRLPGVVVAFPKRMAKRLLPTRLKNGIFGIARRVRGLRVVGPGLRLIWFGIFNEAIFRCFKYDLERFGNHSGTSGLNDTQTHIKSRIVMDYHRLEKGLSLNTPRPGFGVVAAHRLIANLEKYVGQFGIDNTVETAASALQEYHEFNQRNGLEDELVVSSVNRFRRGDRPDVTECIGGTRKLKRDDLLAVAKLDLAEFFSSRHSVRDFSSQEVEMSLLERAVLMATTTPSVCNRQAARVHVLKTPEAKREALKWQNGNRGFSDRIDKVLIVTVDLECFVDPTERYQAWIDGGMFSMSLVYALHSLGLGTCCLNWDVRPETDQGLRDSMQIPGNESIIMLIAVGHLPEEFSVAASTRKALGSFWVVH